MLKFVPADDLSESATDATNTTSLDLGLIQVGESQSASLRIANTGTIETDYTLSLAADPTILIEIEPDSGTLAADEISDTTTISIIPELEASGIRSIDLTATDGTGSTYRLELYFVVVGINEQRASQSPERETAFTSNVSNVVTAVGEWIKIYRYDPVAFNPNDTRVIIDTDRTRKLSGTAANHGWLSQSYEERLNPLNETWGYVRSDEKIIGSFHDETTDVEIAFKRNNTQMTYTSSAFLVVSAEFELPRLWSLFEYDKPHSPDSAQYKRTVFLFRRQADVWCLHHIYSRYKGNELSHFECEVLQLHNSGLGSSQFFNPFSFTYELEIDKPYANYPVNFGDLFASIGVDGSGSNALGS